MNQPLYFAAMKTGMTEAEVINLLCEEGVISDHCTDLKDVCDFDAAKAVELLRDYAPKIK